MNYNTLNELKIVVLCGGLSTERNISFLTGSRVCGALRAKGHRAVLAGSESCEKVQKVEEPLAVR